MPDSLISRLRPELRPELREALVISPFSSTPRDAGHRRRVHQMTRLLADGGYRITFLLVAFEDCWAWRHDAAGFAALREQWDEVMVVYAGPRVGRPPENGDRHGLDEWWEPMLEHALCNMAARRFFDVVVVHNVWLSKAFDFVHPQTTRVLETHDLFWQRPDAFARMGRAAEFFVTDQASELFGIGRADIVVAIQEQEARTLLRLTQRRVVNVPFYETELEPALPTKPRVASVEKVRFGFLASANPFNVHGINTLLAALEARIGESFAPIEMVVAGTVGQHVRSSLPVQCVGRVESEAEFYATVDYAVIPVFDGTGFKIKTADALAVGVPMLVSAHAAAGTRIDPVLVCRDADEMAARMVQIALQEPRARPRASQLAMARDDLRARAAAGGESLLRAIARHGSPMVIDLREADLGRDALLLQSWLGMVRVLAGQRRVVLKLPAELRRLVGRLLPPGVSASVGDGWLDEWPEMLLIDAAGGPPPSVAALSGGRVVKDRRWPGQVEAAPQGPAADAAAMAVDGLPRLHPNVAWEPACLRLREAWAALPDSRAALAAGAPTLLLRDGAGNARSVALGGGRAMRIVDAQAWQAVQTALMALLHGVPGGGEVVWSGTDPAVQRVVLDVCAAFRLPCRGMVDLCAQAPARAPAALADDIGLRVAFLAGGLRHAAAAAREYRA